MSRRVVLIRAVNVGGTAKLPMAHFRAMAQSLGATGVSTYIASGNMVCTLPGAAGEFDRALEQLVEDQCGFFREVISRSPEELRTALAAHPFEVSNPKFSYITFLTSPPRPEAVSAAQELETGEDRWRVIGSDMHIRYAAGAGRPQMNGPAVGRTLGVPGTARNLNTVRKLIALAEDQSA